MADRERFTSREWSDIGATIKAEIERRKGNREALEAEWAEVDRQVAMDPQAQEVSSGDAKDWFPDVELPLQFNALEVIAGDARGLKFPRGSEWFSVSAELSDDYLKRFMDRRERSSLLQPTGIPEAEEAGQQANTQIKLDQETANVLIKATMDHYHRLYDFRQQINLLDAEAIKYGTFVGRVRPVSIANFSYDFRGVTSQNLLGPAVIACSIKNTYLDDTASAVLHEGIKPSRSVIRTMTQRLEDLKKAARKGGSDKGWIVSQVNKIKPISDEKGRQNFVNLAEFEGDLIVPRSRGSIFLPNVIVTVALGPGEPRPVRFRTSPVPFHSYVVGHYMRHDVLSPYGVSPLMKAASIQEAATLAFNSMEAVAALIAQPPIAYDRNDQELAAAGGPEWSPGAKWPTDSPNAVEVQNVGDLGAVLNVYLALLKQHEDLTGANDPRRGAPARSHTSATASENEINRGVARTLDFVSDVEQGPLTTMLYMEYAIIKQVMTSPQPIAIETGGIEGWARIAAADLADNVAFHVQGSAGVASERQRTANFEAAANFAVQLKTVAAQLNIQMPLDFEELATERFNRAGVQNASRFVGGNEGVSTPASGGPQVPRPGGQPPQGGIAPLAAT